MTIVPIRSRSGDLPPGTVNGFCVPCKRDVIAQADDPRCEDCNTELHPASLAHPPAHRIATQEGQPEPKAPDLTPGSAAAQKAQSRPSETQTKAAQPLVLPRLDEAVAWRADTQRLRDQLAAEEAELLRRLSGVQAVRKALSRVLASVQLEPDPNDQPVAAAVEIVPVETAPSPPLPVAEPSTNGHAPLPTPRIVDRLAVMPGEKRWARNYDACRNCSTRTVKHASKGRCMTCQSYWQRTGQERPITRTEDTHDGSQ